MRKFLKRAEIIVVFVIIFCFILFLPGFTTYFHQDDFIHLSYSQNLSQVVGGFNIFQKGEFPFYRPIPTQLYFFVNKTLFGLNPLGYHLVNFLIFSVNVLLIFKLAKLITKDKAVSVVAVIFFAVNSTHFAPLYSPAYVHELFYVLFGVLTVYKFLQKNYIFSILFFIFALMSKETAVVLPVIIFLTYWFTAKTKKTDTAVKILLPYVVILGIYLFAHFFYYGIASGPSYTLMLGKQTVNILGWYFLWAASTPNILIDFVGPGIKISPVFLQVSQTNGIIYFILFPILMLIGLALSVKLVKSETENRSWVNLRYVVFGLAWFVIGMIPLIIFPLHKLATEQAFSLVGLSIALAALVAAVRKNTAISALFVVVYLVVAINSIILARHTHWIVRSAQQAKNTVDFIKDNFPSLTDNASLYFRDGEIKIAPYGSSKQIYQALGNGIGLKLVLNKPNLNLYFEVVNPLPEDLNKSKDIIQIDSSKLLGY